MKQILAFNSHRANQHTWLASIKPFPIYSRMQIPMAAAAVSLGGNVRVGLEDNIYLSRGVLATNEQLVKRIYDIIPEARSVVE